MNLKNSPALGAKLGQNSQKAKASGPKKVNRQDKLKETHLAGLLQISIEQVAVAEPKGKGLHVPCPHIKKELGPCGIERGNTARAQAFAPGMVIKQVGPQPLEVEYVGKARIRVGYGEVIIDPKSPHTGKIEAVVPP